MVCVARPAGRVDYTSVGVSVVVTADRSPLSERRSLAHTHTAHAPRSTRNNNSTHFNTAALK